VITEVRHIASGAIEPQSSINERLPGALRLCSTFVVCGFLLLVVNGCNRGPERVPVAGQVLIDGKPLTTGTIRFVPETGRPASARIEDDGSFRVSTKTLAGGGAEIPGLFPGSYRMAVMASESLGESENAEVHWFAPPRYANFRTSGLETNIQAPTEKLVLELTWEGAEETDQESDEKAETEESSSADKDRETPREEKSDG